MDVSEGRHYEKYINNESYEVMNVDMEVRIVQGHGMPFGKTLEYWFGEPPL